MTHDPLGMADRFRLIVWQLTGTAGFESAWLQVAGLRVRAVGQAVAQHPVPYWLSYILETDSQAVTASLEVTATMLGWEQRLDLRRDRQGWTADGERRPDLADALDCDLGWSPMTMMLPVIRHGLHHHPGTQPLMVASVAVPSLQVSPVRQAYTHLGPAGAPGLGAGAAGAGAAGAGAAGAGAAGAGPAGAGPAGGSGGAAGSGAWVRRSRGSLSADFLVDGDGLVIDYPEEARRIVDDQTGHVTRREPVNGHDVGRPGDYPGRQ